MSDLIVGVTECIETLEITPRQVMAAMSKGMRTALKQHQKMAIEGLKAKVAGATRPNPKYSDTLVDAIMMSVRPGEMFGEITGTLHTMGTQKKGSGTYRTRFFEKGTKDRYQKTWNGKKLKKERYIGKIQPQRFFADAKSGLESTVSSAIQASVEKAIEKINKQ